MILEVAAFILIAAGLLQYQEHRFKCDSYSGGAAGAASGSVGSMGWTKGGSVEASGVAGKLLSPVNEESEVERLLADLSRVIDITNANNVSIFLVETGAVIESLAARRDWRV